MRTMIALAVAAGMTACAAPQQQDHPRAVQRAGAEQLGAELQQSLGSVPTPPDPLTWPQPSAMDEQKFRTWSGFVLVGNDSDGTQAIALPVGDDGIITPAVIAEGVKLSRQSGENGWRFPVPGSVIFQAVLVSQNGHVAGVVDLGANDTAYTGTKVLVGAYHLKTVNGMRLCGHGLCGEIYKLAADKPIDCDGPRCDDVFPQCAPKQRQDNSI